MVSPSFIKSGQRLLKSGGKTSARPATPPRAKSPKAKSKGKSKSKAAAATATATAAAAAGPSAPSTPTATDLDEDEQVALLEETRYFDENTGSGAAQGASSSLEAVPDETSGEARSGSESSPGRVAAPPRMSPAEAAVAAAALVDAVMAAAVPTASASHAAEAAAALVD